MRRGVSLLAPVTRPVPGASHTIRAMASSAGKRPGRRPGDSGTRQAILVAARAQFAARGYDGASLRAIARDAGVDPALVLHYFGSKEELFTVAMAWPFDPDRAVAEVVEGPRAQLGRRLATFFLAIWDDPVTREPIMGMLRAATTSDHAAGLLRQTVGQQLLGPLAAEVGGDDAPLRLNLCMSHLVGVGIARYIVAVDPLASLPTEELVDHLAPTLQRYLTGKL
jgi:AcrR family transcriptional regulator